MASDMAEPSAPAGRLTPERERACTVEFIGKPRKLSNAEFDTLVVFLEDRGLAVVPDIEFLN